MTSLLVHCCPGHKSTSIIVPDLFSRTLPITCRQRDSGVAFRECSSLYYQRGMSPIFPRSESSEFWDLVIPWEQGLDRWPSRFGSHKGQTAEGVGQNPPESHS